MLFSKFKYDPVVKFGNLFNWTSMELENYDFDLEAEDLADVSNQVNFYLLAYNLVENKTDFRPIKYMPSKVVDVFEKQVGLIGYVTTHTLTLQNLTCLISHFWMKVYGEKLKD
jgi:2',3'-cyclic-nucleotide 2'-phosphodiesterase (5'-nucleotidase family)